VSFLSQLERNRNDRSLSSKTLTAMENLINAGVCRQPEYLTGIQVSGVGFMSHQREPALFRRQNHDDKPDGPPKILLDGWTYKGRAQRHLHATWGPEGWFMVGMGCRFIAGGQRGHRTSPHASGPGL
jgi:hypothetical protein